MDTALIPPSPLHILAFDIGGSGVKAAVLDDQGNLLTERAREKTPHPCPPDVLLSTMVKVADELGRTDFDRISVGFPGVVRRGVVLTAVNLGATLEGFDLAAALNQHFGHPTRVINDADMQGLAAVAGRGVEVVLTLGTGMGSALFSEGQLGPHLELAHHRFRHGETYEEQLGDAALKRVGPAKWNRRVRRAVAAVRGLTTFDHLYLGGGNGKLVDFPLAADVSVVDNTNGIKGGAWLWRQGVQPS